jgi:hypothetical protein
MESASNITFIIIQISFTDLTGIEIGKFKLVAHDELVVR